MSVDLPVPDHTAISRRAARLTPVLRTTLPIGPVTLVIDSTGLKVYGAGEWHPHGVRGRPTSSIWRSTRRAVDGGD
jgi:hypothetical protein